MDKIITAVAKPFTSFPRDTYQFCVSPDGSVRVYDDVAGHYTRCHSLSATAQTRIRDIAAQSAHA